MDRKCEVLVTLVYPYMRRRSGDDDTFMFGRIENAPKDRDSHSSWTIVSIASVESKMIFLRAGVVVSSADWGSCPDR